MVVPGFMLSLKAQDFEISRPRVVRLMKKRGMVAKMQRLFKTTS